MLKIKLESTKTNKTKTIGGCDILVELNCKYVNIFYFSKKKEYMYGNSQLLNVMQRHNQNTIKQNKYKHLSMKSDCCDVNFDSMHYILFLCNITTNSIVRVWCMHTLWKIVRVWCVVVTKQHSKKQKNKMYPIVFI